MSECPNQCRGLEEAAMRLAVSPLTLRRWARDRKIESVRLGRRLVFRDAALEAFITAGIRVKK
jgi:excisionase family DNA binding protein